MTIARAADLCVRPRVIQQHRRSTGGPRSCQATGSPTWLLGGAVRRGVKPSNEKSLPGRA